MIFKVKIENFGKLKNEELSINNFTVLAGPNNSGKSFVSKILYSIFKAMRANHAKAYLSQQIARIQLEWRWILLRRHDAADEDLLEKELEALTSLIENCPNGNIEELQSFVPQIVSQIDRVIDTAKQTPENSTAKKSKRYIGNTRRRPTITELAESLIEYKYRLTELSAGEIISRGMEVELGNKFKDNFQAASISQLACNEKLPIVIEIENIGIFKFFDGKPSIDLYETWRENVLPFSRLIFVESPIYWKLRTALEDSRHFIRVGWFDRKPITGVPGYFHDLARALRFDYSGDIAFPDLYKKLTSERILGGKLAISEEGKLSYLENGRSFSLMQTATGIANIGFLALLIECKILDENSFIFIDEPEAHLHPAWQVVMAETLFQLAKNGVHVVIATHSIDILKWVDVHVKKIPDDRNYIALNQLPKSDGIDDDNFDDKLAAIKDELIKPFSDLYLEGL